MKLDVLVVGDIVRDTVILPAFDDLRSTPDDDRADPYRTYLRQSAFGGTALLAHTVDEALKPSPDTADATVFSYDRAQLGGGVWPESLTVLERYPDKTGAKPVQTNLVYRIDKVLGWVVEENLSTAPPPNPVDTLTGLLRSLKPVRDLLPGSGPDATTARLIVINDRDKGFRDLRPDTVSALAPANSQPHFIVSMDYPLRDALGKAPWRLISSDGHRERSVVVLAASSLRQEGINIRELASIERTVEQFLAHLDTSDLLQRLCRCGYLVIRFDDGGVLFVTNSVITLTNRNVMYLSCPFFDTDEELYPQRYGMLTGYRTIMVAALARGMASAICGGQSIIGGIEQGIRLGVLLCKQHYRNGFGRPDRTAPAVEPATFLAQPIDGLFASFDSAPASTPGEDGDRETFVVSLKLPSSQYHMARWSRVDGFRGRFSDDRTYEQGLIKAVEEGLDAVALTHGSTASSATKLWFPSERVLCPYAEFGKIKTVDRQEIDNLTSLSAVIRKYLENPRWRKPISIAAFGPPGSGKSFTAKQLLRSVDRQREQEPLEYNIAQFASVDDLTAAFHQAQDKALSEEVPLIIFDEFDAAFEGELGWLKYFLAPMQDGKFKGRAGTYQVGRAIFVFAGGTARTFAEFCERAEHGETFRNAKGPDFVSRLRGYLDIGDINAAGEMSDLLMFRRAILLRSLLEDKAAAIIDQHTHKARIDSKIVAAFIKAKAYRHGVRSMEAILEMARLERGRFVIASLPPRDQLAMHVDPDEFLNHLRS